MLRIDQVDFNFLMVVLLLQCHFGTAGSGELVLQGFLSMTGEGWPGGGAGLPAAMVALRHVKEYPGLLEDYNLTFNWEDSECDPGEAPYKMFQALSVPPTKIMILGCSCSIATVATAQVSHRFNLTQISPVSSSPALSDRARFPNFFRLIGPDHNQNPAKIAMMKLFNWKKVATINQAFEMFSKVTDDFVQGVKGTDITIISQEIFQHSPYSRVANLKKHDARIIVANCYEDKARLILCAAYKLNLYGPKIVWMFIHWYSLGFWLADLENVPCTADEMNQAVEGVFLFGFSYTNHGRSITGINATEFETLYKQEETYDPFFRPFEQLKNLFYDHIWVAALALNCTDTYLKAIGHPKKLDDFTYEDSDINDIIVSCVANVSFEGVSGHIAFDQGSDPVKNILIERIEDGRRVIAGEYIVEQRPEHFAWNGEGIKWKDGNIPRDSTHIIHEEMSIPAWLYVTMATFAGLGILVAGSLFMFNVYYRQNRIVKLSSPNINNVLLIGCILTYCTIFMKPTNQNMDGVICKIRSLFFAVGFTTAFGALFSKTWRVYKIFTNKKLMQVRIRDAQLVGLVLIMNAVIVLIVIIWESIGPQVVVVKEMTKDVYVIGNDAEVRPYVRMCYSRYGDYFSWTIYISEGVLLAFGAFLAWETRHVKIEALNDSHQIGMCLYNVIVLSAVGLTFTLILEGSVVLIYGIVSTCVIIGTTLTQAIVFVPKVMAVYGHYPPSVQTVDDTLTSRQATSQPSSNLVSATRNIDSTVHDSVS